MREVISAINAAKTFNELSSECYRYFAKRGVCHFSYFHFPPIGAIDFDDVKVIVWLGYPEAWVAAYKRTGFAYSDPIIERLLRENRPVWTKHVLGASDASPEEKAYLKLLIDCKVNDDLAVPVYGPGGRNGGYGIGFEDDAMDLSPAEIDEIQWICQKAHLKYCELLDQKLERPPDLSARETEVLRFVAQGRPNSTIAETMSVSIKTVETYLSRVFLKLDVGDRMTAALRAISLGII